MSASHSPSFSTAAKLVLVMAAAFPWLYPFAPPPTSFAYTWIFAFLSLGTCMIAGYLGKFSASQFFSYAVSGWFVAGLFNALICLRQYLGIPLPELPFDLQNWVLPPSPGSAFGHLRQRNQAATFLCVALASAFYLNDRFSNSRWSLGLTIGTLIIGCGVALTGSRTGLVQLVVLCVAAGWIWRRNAVSIRPVITAGFGFCTAALFGPTVLNALHPALQVTAPSVLQRLAESSDCDNRVVMWTNVLELISRQPWTGWGWGQLAYAHYLSDYSWTPLGGFSQRFCGVLGNAHNLVLHLAVELGVPVAILFCAIVILWIFKSKPWRPASAQHSLAWTIVLLLGFHSLLEYPLWYGTFFGLGAVCLWRVLRPNINTQPSASAISRVHGLQAAAALVLVGFGNYIYADYNRVMQLYKPHHLISPWYQDDPYGHAQKSWLFRSYVQYARLTTSKLTVENAPESLDRAEYVIRHFPDAKVSIALVDAAELLGQQALFNLHKDRLEKVYPNDFQLWQKARASSKKIVAPGQTG